MAEKLVITRVFDAPRERVWKALTESTELKRWWGPRGFTSPVYDIDLRPGGEYLACMRAPDGKEYWSRGVFCEVMPPERLIMTDSFADEHGNSVPASYYGMSGDWPMEMVVTLTLEEEGDKTKLTLVHSGLGGISETDRRNMEQGWDESFDKLEGFLTGRRAMAA